MIKVALSFPINKFHKKYDTYIMINASNEGICDELWRKNISFPINKFHKK